jgi:integrase/recombinase XerD
VLAASKTHLKDEKFEKKIDFATAGLRPFIHKDLIENVSTKNARTIAEYVLAMKTETNLSDNYRATIIQLLSTLSKYHNNKNFSDLTRDDIISYLESLRKLDVSDPLHKWIGTYNLKRTMFLTFFKWLYHPNDPLRDRKIPSVMQNVTILKRKEQSIYKPTDLWTQEDDSLFLKYCPSKRMKCYHMVSRDSSCRPHEILKLKIKDIVFKITHDKKQYAEILVNGKTGSRNIPLINSIPYVKDYLDHEHPQPGNPNAPFICGLGKSLGKSIGVFSLYVIYDRYKEEHFPKLLDNPGVMPEDKQKIKELLKKPWNPYIRRHSALTEKSLNPKMAHLLSQHAGWVQGSTMAQKYTHYFGNESSMSILEAYGIIQKDKQLSDTLKPKQCPNCSEPNKPDSKFCAKCRMVLAYDAYNETLEKQQEKESEVHRLQQQYEHDMKSMREEMKQQFKKIMMMVQKNPMLSQVKPEALARKRVS